MLIIVKDISFYGRRYAAVFAEVLRETETRYYVRAIEGYAKGGKGNHYVEKVDVIATNATREMWVAIKQADELYLEEYRRTQQMLREVHKAAVEAIIHA